jgi:hypothetical protein
MDGVEQYVPGTRHVVESAIDASKRHGTWEGLQAEWHREYPGSTWAEITQPESEGAR